eukprot:CAMPEP_0116021666 /NCGR_PEP_ID=MMETSP0321-20121206/10531_1 /TAXON_ID=163516 /ORGANISM="Leptocylindrus danicus var. danicus, Strain B650" /LENGTH=143 /DNA_ID=CAMNT_0003492597 /DNA_START=199 /DNA_END=631 /DNA_ORIENTATION=+
MDELRNNSKDLLFSAKNYFFNSGNTRDFLFGCLTIGRDNRGYDKASSSTAVLRLDGSRPCPISKFSRFCISKLIILETLSELLLISDCCVLLDAPLPRLLRLGPPGMGIPITGTPCMAAIRAEMLFVDDFRAVALLPDDDGRS